MKQENNEIKNSTSLLRHEYNGTIKETNNRIKKAIEILDEDKDDAAKKSINILKPIKSKMPKDLRNKYEMFVEQEITIGEMLETLRELDEAYKKEGFLLKLNKLK